MAWIRTVDESSASGALKDLYDQQRRQTGAVANILKVHSLAPHLLAAHLELYQAAMHAPGELSRERREMIAVAVSWANHCGY